MTESTRTGRIPRPSAWSVLIALLGLFLLYLAITSLGPVLKAARPGEGIPGTFTAERLNCVNHPGHTACDWEGAFHSHDGARTLAPVSLYGGVGDLTEGGRIQARDVGRSSQVYRTDGTREWVLTSGLAVLGLVLMMTPAVQEKRRRAGRS